MLSFGFFFNDPLEMIVLCWLDYNQFYYTFIIYGNIFIESIANISGTQYGRTITVENMLTNSLFCNWAKFPSVDGDINGEVG